jgi:hypothetical protein
VHDNHIELTQPTQIYMMSKRFFMFFADQYGCDVEIKLVKFEQLDDMIDTHYRLSNNWIISFDIDPNSFYNVHRERILSMDLEERKKVETDMMSTH